MRPLVTFACCYPWLCTELPASISPPWLRARHGGNGACGLRTSYLRLLVICGVALACMLAGCSKVRLVYNNADWLVVTYVNGYLDLTSQQKKQLRTELRQALNQYRHEDLRSTVAFMRTVGKYAADGLTEPELDELINTLMRLYETGVAKAASVFAPTMVDLSAAQIAHLYRELAHYNRDYREKYLAISLSERQDERAIRAVTYVEKWTGELSRAQRDMVLGISRSSPDLFQTWYDYDIAMQRELLKLLRAGAPVDEVQAHLTGWWLLQSGRGTELAQQKERLIRGMRMFVHALDSSFTPEQREHLLRRIFALADELETLFLGPETTVATVTS